MKKVENKELIARLNQRYAQKQAGHKKQGIEMLPCAWFFEEKEQEYLLRAMFGNKPGAYLQRISPSEL